MTGNLARRLSRIFTGHKAEDPHRGPLSDDEQGWEAELRASLLASSPESCVAASEAGLLDGHIARLCDAGRSMVRAAVGAGTSRENALRDAGLWLLTNATPVPAPVRELVVIAEPAITHPLSDDNARWEEDLRLFLSASSPEGYAEAVKKGRLDPHLALLCTQARQRMRTSVDNGLLPDEALAVAKNWLLGASTPIPELASEYIGAAHQSRALKFQQFQNIVERYRFANDDQGYSNARQIMSVIVERPDFGDLLATSAFRLGFSTEPLYALCLGARHFGNGMLEAAESSFRDALAIQASVIGYVALANTLRALARWSDALAVLETGIERYPDDRLLTNLAAGTSFALGNSERANAFIAPYIDSFFTSFPRREYIETRRHELERAIATRQMYRETQNDVYDDAFAYSTWWNYWHHFNSYNRFQHPEGVLADIVPDYLESAFRRLSEAPDAFVEIGTMCGEIVDRLAGRFQSTRFYGVDRQQNVKSLNDLAYRRENVEFVADDIFAFLKHKTPSFKNGMLFHVRTAPFLYPAFLESLYRESAAHGVRYITLFETYPISYAQRRFRSFAEMDEIAEIRGGGLIHHNYPLALELAGFKVIHEEIATPTLLFSGMDNSVFIVAERAG